MLRQRPPRLTLWIAFLASSLSGCGSGELQTREEVVKMQWSEAVNLYQRRSDLVPDVLEKLRALGFDDVEAIAAVEAAQGNTRADPPTPALLDDSHAFARSQAAQLQLRAALGRLMESVEQFSAVSSDPALRDLRAQLQDTERRIAQVRLRYGEASQAFNGSIREFPARLTAALLDLKPVPGMARVEPGGGTLSSTPGDSARPVASN
jgi:LemA protein